MSQNDRVFTNQSIEQVTIDPERGRYYVQFNHARITRTVIFDEETNVDVDGEGNIVGIEIMGEEYVN